MASIQTFNKERYIHDWMKFHHNLERTQYRLFKQALDIQLKPVLDYIRQNGVTSLQQHLSVLVSEQPIKVAYRKCYQQCGMESAKWQYNKIKSLAERKSMVVLEYGEPGTETKSIPSFFSETWRKLMNLFFDTEAGERITSVTDTTKERVQQLLSEASEQHLTIEETATYLDDRISDPDFNRNKALVIARTETTTGANKGASLGANSSDYETVKEWLAVEDANTRPTHTIADGQQVDVTEDFVVGSEFAQYPGDPRLSAKECIQCRCTAVYRPKLDGSGLPILKIL